MKSILALAVVALLFLANGCAAYMERQRGTQILAENEQIRAANCRAATGDARIQFCVRDLVRNMGEMMPPTPINSEFIAFMRIQASRVERNEMSVEEFEYILVRKLNEVNAAVANPPQPNTLQRAGEILQGRPDPLYGSRGLHCTSRRDPISGNVQTDCY